jgi:hypothetical protein
MPRALSAAASKHGNVHFTCHAWAVYGVYPRAHQSGFSGRTGRHPSSALLSCLACAGVRDGHVQCVGCIQTPLW